MKFRVGVTTAYNWQEQLSSQHILRRHTTIILHHVS